MSKSRKGADMWATFFTWIALLGFALILLVVSVWVVEAVLRYFGFIDE